MFLPSRLFVQRARSKLSFSLFLLPLEVPTRVVPFLPLVFSPATLNQTAQSNSPLPTSSIAVSPPLKSSYIIGVSFFILFFLFGNASPVPSLDWRLSRKTCVFFPSLLFLCRFVFFNIFLRSNDTSSSSPFYITFCEEEQVGEFPPPMKSFSFDFHWLSHPTLAFPLFPSSQRMPPHGCPSPPKGLRGSACRTVPFLPSR